MVGDVGEVGADDVGVDEVGADVDVVVVVVVVDVVVGVVGVVRVVGVVDVVGVVAVDAVDAVDADDAVDVVGVVDVGVDIDAVLGVPGVATSPDAGGRGRATPLRGGVVGPGATFTDVVDTGAPGAAGATIPGVVESTGAMMSGAMTSGATWSGATTSARVS